MPCDHCESKNDDQQSIMYMYMTHTANQIRGHLIPQGHVVAKLWPPRLLFRHPYATREGKTPTYETCSRNGVQGIHNLFLLVSLLCISLVFFFFNLFSRWINGKHQQMGRGVLLAFWCTVTWLVSANAQLSAGFYSESCPRAEATVRSVMEKAVQREPRNAASVMRLQFHDCLVNGCDGSLLLDDTPTMVGEKAALSNINSLRAFEVIDEIKEALEQICPLTVSCADIIIMAARDAVVLSGGPSWEVLLGRRDSLTASQNDSNVMMPSPRANVATLVPLFRSVGLSVTDLVALSGSHTIGKGRCFSIVFRLYNQSGSGKPDPTIEPRYRQYLDGLCPQGGDGNVTGDLDSVTPTVFDNQYFRNLVDGKGFLNSDQVLFSTFGETRDLVETFSADEAAFFSSFATSMINLGNIFASHTSRCGEIRKNCRRVNRDSQS